jgi:hypothetical protein
MRAQKQLEKGEIMNRIDTIIDALYKTKLLMDAHGQYPHTLREVDEALAAARELQALKPAAWAEKKSIHGGYEGLSFDKQPRFDTPLYALDEVTK